MLAKPQKHSTWGCYSCSVNVKQLPQIYGFLNPKRLLLLGLLTSSELLTLKKKINSNKTAHYYQVRFKYLAEKSKLIFGSFNSTPLKTAVVMMPDYFVVDNELW